jgi:hypothetical protein
MKKEDLLLNQEGIKKSKKVAFENWHNTQQAQELLRLETKDAWEDLRNEAYFKQVANSASLKTAKAIRDDFKQKLNDDYEIFLGFEENQFHGYLVPPDFLNNLDKVINEMEKE